MSTRYRVSFEIEADWLPQFDNADYIGYEVDRGVCEYLGSLTNLIVERMEGATS